MKAASDQQSFEIYTLIDPRTHSVRYVGRSKDAKKRHKQHINRKNAAGWVKELLEQGTQPILDIIESSIPDLATAKQREEYWVHYYEGQGYPLENLEYNEHAHRYRAERESLYKHLYNNFASYLSPAKAQLLTQMTIEGYDKVSPAPWSINYTAVVGTLKLLIEKYGVHHQLDEIDAARLTFYMFGYEWNEDGTVKEVSNNE